MAYTNSPLSAGLILSPNRTAPRNHAIDRITIHHMAACQSAVACANSFVPVKRQASANYCIGNSGDIITSVPESDRSWCSASRENDHRAITMEVSNDRSGVNTGTWTVGDAAMQSTINLCADVCQRNALNKVIWFGDKATSLSYVPKPGECIMTVHQWFQATACPGPYFMKVMGDVANSINAKLSGVAPSPIVNPKPLIAKPTLAYSKKYIAQVVYLQQDLNYLGYTDNKGRKLTVDGYFGPSTKEALMKFQNVAFNGDKGEIDGIYGNKTCNKMIVAIGV